MVLLASRRKKLQEGAARLDVRPQSIGNPIVHIVRKLQVG